MSTETMTLPDIDAPAAERVAYGAVRLDELKSGWFEKINLDRLNMLDIFDCVLGQIYGDFDYATDVLSLTENDGFRYGVNDHSEHIPGFYATSMADPEYHSCKAEIKRRFDELTELWKAEILARREGTQEAEA